MTEQQLITLTPRQLGKIIRTAYSEGGWREVRGTCIGNPETYCRDSIDIDKLAKIMIDHAKKGEVYKPGPQMEDRVLIGY